MRDVTDLIGRIFLATIFIFEAVDSILYFDKTKLAMTAHGVTWNQDFLLYGAIFLLTVGGLMVLFGYRSTLGAVLLLMYWVPVPSNWPMPSVVCRMLLIWKCYAVSKERRQRTISMRYLASFVTKRARCFP